MTTHDDVTGDRTHYHGDGCTPPHPAATLAQALHNFRWATDVHGSVTSYEYAAEVLRLLASGECDELNAAVADAVAANPEAFGLRYLGYAWDEAIKQGVHAYGLNEVPT